MPEANGCATTSRSRCDALERGDRLREGVGASGCRCGCRSSRPADRRAGRRTPAPSRRRTPPSGRPAGRAAPAPDGGAGGGWTARVCSPSSLADLRSRRLHERRAPCPPGVMPSCTTATTCSVMGMSTSCLRARSRIERQDFTPSAVCCFCASICSSVSPRPSFSPKVRLRDSGEVQVATRSPSPASPEKVMRVGAERGAQPGGLGEAAGDERGLGVVAEAHALGHAGGQRDDVLHRAAELAADDVGVGVRPEVRPSCRRPAAARPRRRRCTRRRWPPAGPAAISLARFGPGDHGDPVAAARRRPRR